MPVLTSRMEKELIFSSFTVTKPDLCIRGRNTSVLVPYDHYLSEVNCITLLKNEDFFAGNEVVVSFLYKKAKIFFKTIIERENTLFFRIPQDIHVLRKKKKKNKFPSMKLYYQNFLLSTFAPPQLDKRRKAEVMQNTNIKDVFIQSQSMGHNLFYLLTEMKQCIPVGKDLYSHLNIISNFLKEKKKKDAKRKENKKNLFIFSDSHVILLFSNSNFALQFASDKLKKFKADISFKDRNITCEVQYSFFSPFENLAKKEIVARKELNHSYGFLGFRIVEIQEEDKRYLYESVFSTRYEA